MIRPCWRNVVTEAAVHSMHNQDMQQDRQTVTLQGESLEHLPARVSFYDLPVQIDERGSVRERRLPLHSIRPARGRPARLPPLART